jgi:laminin beta 1
VVQPPSCLEPNKLYKIKLDFIRLGSNVQGREASILIDSILLVPAIEDLTSLQSTEKGSMEKEEFVLDRNKLDEFRYYGCKEAQLGIHKDNLNPSCAKFMCNIGIHSDGALSCDCNPTGSKSNLCNPFGGLCQCKPNVVGPKCDRCAPGTWGFGPNGCQPCNCNGAGAKTDLCDVETGQCDCHDRIIGKDCGQCQPNSWRFPACEECNCNGFADSCNQTTGHCIDCRDHTIGNYCAE